VHAAAARAMAVNVSLCVMSGVWEGSEICYERGCNVIRITAE
jgi:hypothetical protein